jgi:hypothetical protein
MSHRYLFLGLRSAAVRKTEIERSFGPYPFRVVREGSGTHAAHPDHGRHQGKNKKHAGRSGPQPPLSFQDVSLCT